MNETPNLDELDHKLIHMLAEDARVSNRKIAAELGVTEGTVRGRIKRLQQDRLIAFTAITGLEMAYKSRLAFIGIQVETTRVHEVAQQISEMSDVNAVIVSLGEFNVVAICLFGELEEIVEVASERILSIPGVYRIETSVAVKTLKYNARIARITSDAEDLD